MILLIATSTSGAYASPLGWPQRLAGVRHCYAARVIFLEAAGEASTLLWCASSDNYRNGFLAPSVVTAARQRVQEAIAAADWRFTKLAASKDIDPGECRQHARDAGSRIMGLVRVILTGGTLPQAPLAQHPQRPSLN